MPRLFNLRHKTFLPCLLLMFFMAFLAYEPTCAATLTGRLVKVIDGDTVEVLGEGKTARIRLAQIDAPETDQPFGQAAKRFVLAIAAQQVVQVQFETIDRYGRMVGEIILPNGTNLNKQIVSAGYAWQYKRYSRERIYADLEEQARAAKLGLWRDANPVPPWEWRHGNRSAGSALSEIPEFSCGAKRSCQDMSSCQEAMFYLKRCGEKRLDGDHDGVPCETLCR